MNRQKPLLFLTKNRYLFRKAELELGDDFLLTRADALTEETKLPAGALLLVDLDTAEENRSGKPLPRDAVFLSHSEAALENRARTLLLPFPIGALAAQLSGASGEPMLTLLKKQRSARLAGQTIRLSELEYALLARLIEAGGEPVGREELGKVFPNGATDGMTNVYIHYLREKLETGGEKIILSCRNTGYRLNEKYLRARGAEEKEEPEC